MPSIGRYDNPYRVAVWDREPPAGTRCEPLLLETPDRALAQGWLYSRGGEDTVVCLMHPRADFAHHYAVTGLVERGYAVFCENSRWLNNDATLLHEVVLLDVAAGVAAMRERFDRVVLCGNSGGGSLYTFYLHQALAPPGRAPARHRGRRSLRSRSLRSSRRRRDGVPGRARRRRPLPPLGDRPFGGRRDRSGRVRSRARHVRPRERVRRAARRDALRARVPHPLPRGATRPGRSDRCGSAAATHDASRRARRTELVSRRVGPRRGGGRSRPIS